MIDFEAKEVAACQKPSVEPLLIGEVHVDTFDSMCDRHSGTRPINAVGSA